VETELHVDADGYLACPRRGDISVEWCEGCPHRRSIAGNGERTVVVCVADPEEVTALDGRSSPLCDVPDIWR